MSDRPPFLGGATPDFVLVCSEAAGVPIGVRIDPATGRQGDRADECSNCGAIVLVLLDYERRAHEQYGPDVRPVCTACATTHLGWTPRTPPRPDRRARRAAATAAGRRN